MKRRIAVWVMILCLVPIYACADFDYSTRDYDVSEDDLVASVKADYPDWDLIDSEQYWTGRWENELACWVEISLMCVTDCTLYQKTLSVIINPLKKGDPVPWEVTDCAPVPLTEEAMSTLLEMDPADLYKDDEGYANDPCMLTQSIVPGCALFLLGEGESWRVLYSYPTALAGVVVNAEGQNCIRIAHWDGEQYDSVTSSRFFSEDQFSINGYHSNASTITVLCRKCDPQFVRQPDGRWLFVGIADGNWTLYWVYDDFVTDATGYALCDSNDVIHYGVFTLDRDLTEADIPAYPDFIRDVIPLLDSSAFACVRSDGTAMLDGPNGQPLADCYSRLTGRILQRKGGYVQLQIGSGEHGMSGWFAKDDLAFGPEIEQVRCGFPSHSEDDCYGRYLTDVLTGIDPEELEDTTYLVWLIGKLPNGDWLVQLDADAVCTAPEDSFRDVGPATELWAEFEAEYDHYEQEMLEWAAEADDAWEDDEE